MDKIIKNGYIWDGNKFELKDIVINDEIIDDVTNSCAGSFDEVINAKGKYVLPGIIDCHVHLSMNAGSHPMATLSQMTESEAMLEAVISASKIIKSGITTVRDCGSLGFEILSLRDEINKGNRVEGPRIFACGKAIKITGGHFIGRVIDGIEDARKAAREMIGAGADFLKFMGSGGLGKIGEQPGLTELDEDEMAMAIKQGKKHDMASASHAHGKQSMLNALNAGITTLEHCTFMDEEVINKILKKDIFVVPTFSPYLLISEKGIKAGVSEYMVNMAKEVYKEKIPRFNKAYKSGIKVAFGRDAGAPFTKHEDFVVEMKAMESAGMNKKDIIISATENAAKALKLWDKIGSIKKGKYADIILLDDNPLDDLENFKKICKVIKGGNEINIINKEESRNDNRKR